MPPEKMCDFNHHNEDIHCAKHLGYNIKPFVGCAADARSSGSRRPAQVMVGPGQAWWGECLQGDALLGPAQEP